MKNRSPARAAGAARQRKHRARATPRWLKNSPPMSPAQTQARMRCLLVLSVLSGETPVSDAIAKAGLSRQTYYNLETRALQGMLRALDPSSAPAQGSATTERLAQLEQQVLSLQQQKRRAERLLMLGRKAMRLSGKIEPLAPMKRGRRARSAPPTSSPTTAPGAISS